MAELKTVFAGFGGQGVLFAGKVMAYAGLIEGREVSWLPSYGPEMRGGTANCSVVLDDAPIGSPLVVQPDVLVALNQPSLDKFLPDMLPGSTIIADTSLIQNIPEVEGVKVFAFPAAQLAEENGCKGLGNIVLVGKLWAETKFCSEETLKAAIEKCVPARHAKKLPLNYTAVELGKNA